MSITFDIPPDVQAGLEGISDLHLRVELYLRLEAQLELFDAKSTARRHAALSQPRSDQ